MRCDPGAAILSRLLLTSERVPLIESKKARNNHLPIAHLHFRIPEIGEGPFWGAVAILRIARIKKSGNGTAPRSGAERVGAVMPGSSEEFPSSPEVVS